MRTMLLVSLLFVTALAGCTGDGDTDADVDGGEGADMAPIDDRVTVQANTSSMEVITIEKSGPPGESYFCLEGCDYVVHPLTTQMEPDTAYFMEATLTWEPGMWEGAPNFFLRGDAGIRDYGGPETDFSAGISEMSATLLAVGDSEVAINIGGGVEAPDYDLEVIMTPVPDAIPQYAPAAVTVPEGGELGVESLSGSGRVMVFDGDDALVGIRSVDEGLTIVVDNVTEAQEFVIVTMDDIWAKAYVVQDAEAPGPQLRHLPIVIEWNDHGTVDSGGAQTFKFDAETPLLQTGFVFGYQSCIPETCYRAVDWSATLFDPDGTEVVSDSGNCELCGGSQGYVTDFIDDGATPAGEYRLEWESSESMSVGMRTVEVSYGR